MSKRAIKIISIIIFISIILFLPLSISSNVALAEEEYLYIGGTPIGIVAKSSYFIVSDIVNVITNDGSYSPAYNAGIRRGDIIVTINGRQVMTINDINDIVQSSDQVIMSVRRGNTLTDITITPAYDIVFNAKKLGFNLKSDVVGIGTLTYIDNKKRYGALGHILSDSNNISSIYQKGEIYKCTITGYNVATDEEPGELRGTIDTKNRIGSIDKNIFCGIFGQYDVGFNYEKYPIGHKDDVKPGKAQMLTTIDGDMPRFYDIEIIKAIKQDKPADKSMVIRVIDKELRSTTGGILQGMSGSPIVQNGKIIGAVTHVFTVDSTKGYGIYIDWMIQNNS